uniref:Uncharacterized protein n=1 Tax=Meloidogyne enterolobii TaxID=390850 RepID=A0A6V7Y8V0_MELEN|nr:unnamed protein product [Meloidogyne enterolobii]
MFWLINKGNSLGSIIVSFVCDSSVLFFETKNLLYIFMKIV